MFTFHPASTCCSSPHPSNLEISVLLWTRLSRECPATLFMCERQIPQKVWTQFSEWCLKTSYLPDHPSFGDWNTIRPLGNSDAFIPLFSYGQALRKHHLIPHKSYCALNSISTSPFSLDLLLYIRKEVLLTQLARDWLMFPVWFRPAACGSTGGLDRQLITTRCTFHQPNW